MKTCTNSLSSGHAAATATRRKSHADERRMLAVFDPLRRGGELLTSFIDTLLQPLFSKMLRRPGIQFVYTLGIYVT